ncbi:MAG: DUF58 domain-containing protein [Methylophilaceae bacterium]
MLANPFRINFWQKWLRVAQSEHKTAVLGVRQIYIIPTRWGLLYGIMLIAMLIGSINYALSLGYFLTFLLAALGNSAMLYTWRNLVHLQVEILDAKPVFAGEMATIFAVIKETKSLTRHAIVSHFNENAKTYSDLEKAEDKRIEIKLATQQRGWLTLPRLTLYTEFPLSLLHAWAYVQSPLRVLVYPTPANNSPLLANLTAFNKEGNLQSTYGDDEFNGHKTYQIGDAASRVDWKASSRGVGMLSKQYSGYGQSTIWLNWESTAGLAHEARISLLTRWVIDANSANFSYGLQLPQQSLAPSQGEAHFVQALSLLALMP